jgi:hypothetical protein
MRQLTVPEKHQLKIARKRLTEVENSHLFLGGPSLPEAKEIIKRLTGKNELMISRSAP